MKSKKEIETKLIEFTEYIEDLNKRINLLTFSSEDEVDEYKKLSNELRAQRYAKSGLEWVLN